MKFTLIPPDSPSYGAKKMDNRAHTLVHLLFVHLRF